MILGTVAMTPLKVGRWRYDIVFDARLRSLFELLEQ